MLPALPLNTSNTIVFIGDSITDAEQYQVTYDQLLLKAKERSDCQIVLVEPFVFCRDRQNPLFRALEPYIEIVGRLAARHETVRVALQEQIDKQIAEVPPEQWSQDMVHPYQWAHAWIAARWLEATGL